MVQDPTKEGVIFHYRIDWLPTEIGMSIVIGMSLAIA